MSPWKMSYAKGWTYQLRPTWNAASGTHHKALITHRQQEINTNLETFVKLGKGRRIRALRAAAASVQTDSSSDGASELPASAYRPTLPHTNPDKLRAPLVDAVRQRGDAGHETPFHVPGHKRGAGAPEGLARLVRPATGSVLQYDLTEIAGLDFLSSPTGVIQEAQQLAAEAFGADQTWFLVNGCSVGIHAAVMAVTAATLEAEVEAEEEVHGPIDTTATAGNTDRDCLIRSMMNGADSSHMRCVSEYDSNRDGSGSSSSSGSSHSGDCGGRTNDGGSRRATLIVARNCHLSAFSSMVLSGCEPYWVQPEVDPVFGVAHCVTHESIRAALYGAADQGRRVVGVLIVSPTYFGAVADVAAIATVCHEHGVPLLVDEAHGGHFAFLPPSAPSPLSPPPSPQPRQQQHNRNHNHQNDDHNHDHNSNNRADESQQTVRVQDEESRVARRELHVPPLPPSRPASPPSALQCGADVVMQSTHKVLGAMTQAAMLHIAGTRVSPSRLSRALQTLQSSSPSYILMASLDAARAQAAAGGTFDEPFAAAQAIREAVSQCQRIRLLDERTAGSKASVRYFDPLRLTLLVSDLPQLPGGGFGAAEWLERQFGIVPELATARTVVLALGPGTTMAHAATAVGAILHLDRLAQGLEAGVPATAESTSDDRGHRIPPPPAAGETSPPASASPTADAEVEVVLTPREAYFSATESVPAAEAVGRVSAELLCPYPPGVPVLFPGERITAAALKVLSSTLTAGGAVTGARDGTLATLTVVAKARRTQLRQWQPHEEDEAK
ncbi:hypothetical protein Vretimale_10865 [Volvox reticuliferus]|uniref:Orn/Lys/Arg decarboxylases family 1 pyridoxal-P attachment site domain-containing protein n=1 Tax=Volvox reticuliferus TaxID=1737510 RepID=A0A8J4GGF0_9CHLO|nr:hypothetical protein Vretifemale_12575 [Volvox reticuliferus]GIM06587.1 hypothetical protein Vretimale_10865 [Volvox reticuliferus]